MIGKFEYKLLPKYPHLRPPEIGVWEAFIEKYPKFYNSVTYDLKVGKPHQYKNKPEDKYREDLEYLSRKRIDVVGYQEESIHIIELKSRAGLKGIGQVLSYVELYEPFAPEGFTVEPVVISTSETPDIRDLCYKFGIQYFLV